MSSDDRLVFHDEVAAERIARAHGGDLYDRLFPPRRRLDREALDAAYAAGELTDAEMAAITVEVRDRPAIDGSGPAPQ